MVKSIGQTLSSSQNVGELINSLVKEVENYSGGLTGVRDPQIEFEMSSNSLIQKINENRGRPLFYPYVGTGIGRGCYVELEDGSVKMDLINGIGIHIMGHSHPEIVRAMLKGALSDVVVQGNLQPNKEYCFLSEKLVALASKGSRLKHCWLTTSGSMANENALKMARQKKSPARKIIAMKDAFAGRTTLMAEITDNPSYKVGLPDYHEVLRLNFPKDVRESEEALSNLKKYIEMEGADIAAFMFEPMQGEGGYWTTSKEWIEPLLKICREKGIAVWADEVQTFCRTGEFFAFDRLGIGSYIDICTVAKTLQSGATLYTEEYNPQPGLIAGTFIGSTPALCAGEKILTLLDEGGYMGPNGRIQKIHEEFVSMLNRLNETTCKGLLRDAGGMGLMVAVTPLDGSKEKMMNLLKVLYKNGMISFGCGHGPFRLRFLLPAVMKSEDIEAAGVIIEKSILEMA